MTFHNGRHFKLYLKNIAMNQLDSPDNTFCLFLLLSVAEQVSFQIEPLCFKQIIITIHEVL
jgi:hypothetical protein